MEWTKLSKNNDMRKQQKQKDGPDYHDTEQKEELLQN